MTPQTMYGPKITRAVLIPADSGPGNLGEVIDLNEADDQLTRLVGRTLDGVTIRVCGQTLYAFINEDGKLKRLKRNWYASKLYNEQSDWICGAMVVTGPVGKLGQSTDVPLECVKAILRRYR